MLDLRFKKMEQRLSPARLLPSVLAALCVVLVATSAAFAQGSRGTISGEVQDQQGAVIAGATVR
ncbi:MAG TPA: hypothetical protein VFR78_20985, partial [Pyrinomonadaceae bacterium]|nr:hypothetical protein [Pyrinomonadaceae bacterium]